jgi:hypothetical protein
MAKLNREARLRERRVIKEANKQARRRGELVRGDGSAELDLDVVDPDVSTIDPDASTVDREVDPEASTVDPEVPADDSAPADS